MRSLRSPRAPSWQSPREAPKTRAELPRLFLGFGRRSHFAAFNACEKGTRQPRFTRMAFSMNRAQIEELIAKRVALPVLVSDGLQGKRQCAQIRGFRPGVVFLFIQRQFEIRKKATSSARAFFQACHQLVGEDATHRVQLFCVRRVSLFDAVYLARISVSTSSAVWGSEASRSIRLPSSPTRKSHSMRTPIFSSGI